MPQKLNLLPNETVLGGLKLEACTLNPLNYQAQVLQMFLQCTREHKYVINVDRHKVNTTLWIQTMQNPLHEPLEDSGGIHQSERHDSEFK